MKSNTELGFSSNVGVLKVGSRLFFIEEKGEVEKESQTCPEMRFRVSSQR
ncbi:hypothetical protein HanXRQr2_Chr07g0289491 [Helianthus annuus]|uniref:Uncharacterized protein n=1 Tax=Helianthus annuus TaxID=4232 RepID=A0A9K3NF98_HELAN|nr:hypothetical protein HanXRQr2_Chr07g0289491 [Helianthus annuus]